MIKPLSDDDETSVDITGTDAGNTEPAPFRGSHLDQARRASDGYERQKSEGESFGGEPDARVVLNDEKDVVRHRGRNSEPISATEAAAELRQQQELRKDPAYSATIDILDQLVEAGSDAKEAEVDYKNAILAAEQRLAARRLGLYDEQPTEVPAEQQPTEQPTEHVNAPSIPKPPRATRT